MRAGARHAAVSVPGIAAVAWVVFAVLLAAPGARGQGIGPAIERRYELPHSAPSAEQAWVVLRLDRSAGSVAERYRLNVQVSGPAGWWVAWPVIEDGLGDFSVASVEERPARGLAEGGAEKGVRLVEERVFVLEPFLAGKHSIPAMTFNFKNDDPAHVSVISVSTEPLDVEVTSTLEGVEPGEVPALEPMRGLVEPSNPGRVPLWAAATSAGAVLIAAAGIALLGARRRRRGIPVLTPAETARARLRELTEMDLPAFGKFEEHYLVLADILRTFAAARFGLPPADRTTEELVSELNGAPGAETDELGRLLGHLDEVKFAGAIPTAATAQQAMDGVVRYVEEHGEEAPGGADGGGPNGAPAPVAAADHGMLEGRSESGREPLPGSYNGGPG